MLFLGIISYPLRVLPLSKRESSCFAVYGPFKRVSISFD